MNKKAMSPEMLIGIIALVGTLAVFLVIVYPPFKNFLFSLLGKTSCNWSLLLATVAKFGAFGGGELPVECQMTKLHVGPKELDSYAVMAKKRINTYLTKPGYEDVKGVYPPNTLGYKHWALDKIVATEMANCWDKTWHGKVNPTDWMKAFHVDVVCVVCTRIEFDPDLPGFLKSYKLDLVPWLKTNNYQGKTYYDYLMQDQQPFAFNNAPWYDINRRWAVVYWSMSPDKAAQFVKKIPGVEWTAERVADAINFFGGNVGVKKDIHQVYLWPFEDITRTDSGGLGCQKIIN